MSNLQSTNQNQNHYAVFGNIKIPRGFCSKCRANSFITDGSFICCGRFAGEISDIVKVECEAENKRRRPRRKRQKEILETQKNRCVYCNQKFGDYISQKGKPVFLLVNWEHFEPFCTSRNNRDDNFLAACQICNGIKRDIIFQSIEEAQVYIQTERTKKGYDEMLELPERNRANNETEEILFSKVPNQSLRENPKSKMQRRSNDKRNSTTFKSKLVKCSSENQKGESAKSKQIRKGFDTQGLSELKETIGKDSLLCRTLSYFIKSYSLSFRKLEKLCRLYGVQVSKNTLHRILTGTASKDFACLIESNLLQCLKKYLIDLGKTTEEANLEMEKLSPYEIEEVLIIPKGKTVKYVIQNEQGETINTVIVKG